MDGGYTPNVATRTPQGSGCPGDATVVAFLDSKLSEEERAAIHIHVDECSACLALVAALTRAGPTQLPEGPERYQIQGEVGTGGMGRVFEAFDTVLGREVALKCVRSGPQDRAAAKRFEREMALTARLQHPSIIPVYDAGLFPDGGRYFAMRLVEGRTLDRAIEGEPTAEGRLTLVPSIRRACEAVAYAHEQSVIHRDLKPANVLIGPFGETVVLDWGLAKLLGEDDSEPSFGSSSDEEDGMTRPGAVMGTPGYIAPEVSGGELADRRADVFSLGKILAKLIPERDAGGETKQELLADFRAIVARATDPDPAHRYSDASGLCDDLRRFEAGHTVSARDYSVRTRVRRFARLHRTPILLSLSFVGLGVLAGSLVASALTADGPEPCSGAQEALAEAWNDERRAQVREAFAAVDKPYAELAWARTESRLDRYAREWIAMHGETCRATARGEQSAELMDLRMACLDRTATQLQANVEVLAEAEATVVQRADEIVQSVLPLARCADSEALSEQRRPPEPHDAVAVEAARTLIARANALRRAGRYDESKPLLDQARVRISDSGYGPIQTELSLAQGLQLIDEGDFEAAVRTLEDAIRAGTRERQWDEVRRAVLQTMYVVGSRQRRAAAALGYAPLLEGLSQDDTKSNSIAHRLKADLLAFEGQFERAQDEYLLATELLKDLTDPAPLEEAATLANYAQLLVEQGRVSEAELQFGRALQIQIETLNEGHPVVALTRARLAGVLDAQGKSARAATEARGALAVQRETLPPEHLDIAHSHNVLGNALVAQGEYARGEVEYRSALSVLSKTLPPEHPNLAATHSNLGGALFSRGDLVQAEAEFSTALKLYEATLSAEQPELIPPLANLGSTLLALGKATEAEARFRQVLGLCEATLPPEHPFAALARSSLAAALLEQERVTEALPLAERAWERREQPDALPEERGETAFLLARLVWASQPQGRTRARALARDARAAFEKAGAAHAERLRETEAWLEHHGED